MAKMFYTLDEAAQKLGKSPDDVRAMAQSGQIQEFRDRDKLMFKTEQIDLLADDGTDLGDPADLSGVIPLADSGEMDSLSKGESQLGESSPGASSFSSGPGLVGDSGEVGGSGLLSGSGDLGGSDLLGGSDADDAPQEDKKERTGVGIFDADEFSDDDPAGMTQVSEGSGSGFELDSLGSGSGLMDLTRESDDTSLGADLLEEVYPGGENEGQSPGAIGGGALFEGDDIEPAVAGGGTVVMVAQEPYEGGASGFLGGLSIGAILSLAIGIGVMVLAVLGAPDGGLLDMLASQFLIVVGGLAGLTLVLGVIGWVLGKRA